MKQDTIDNIKGTYFHITSLLLVVPTIFYIASCNSKRKKSSLFLLTSVNSHIFLTNFFLIWAISFIACRNYPIFAKNYFLSPLILTLITAAIMSTIILLIAITHQLYSIVKDAQLYKISVSELLYDKDLCCYTFSNSINYGLPTFFVTETINIIHNFTQNLRTKTNNNYA
ncbi:hypothetical protein [Candidatus Neoehrlichia procyonis]|uniref:Uncharacterized protein n=1 Tax=Candidatus Neoehrlichia procyonis str. RAC413 TaxID=1359163 RepID=A0A0F3NN51_9RICK|nr:hypothetical protein [Candidatus Neoehrlichia lotoris]KJV69107.1 hypothetical protein NLO413_0483 [Candidatus Neoehrlichia lotoris str. RAC413]